MMDNIVFGPIISRRFGISLGVDLSPSHKQCNFDCLYCELNAQKAQSGMQDILDLDTLIQSVLNALKKSQKIDVLTITANGEPTLYPYLFEFMQAIKENIPKDISTLILSNGSRFGDKNVQKALHLFDIVKFSLDGAEEKSFKRIDRPYKELTLDVLLSGIKDFARTYQGRLVVEVLLVEGVNDGIENINAIVKFLKSIDVYRVDLGTVDRPPAYKATPLSYQRLLEIAKNFEGMFVSLPSRKETIPLIRSHHPKEELFELLSRRPVSLLEAEGLFDEATLGFIKELLEEKKISIKKVLNVEFYVAK